ncbi:efflux RND transporter periplasmic adaptor subunit [Pseudohoeflea coraliihabitans]|uniref:Efflux RND transporter periplasmic adaptor subunit n=1 Tax=Pseudohoeflea coraliihabitans TaxID=2860393 RepID=A0ABS6WM84_9HYPH|nr:efflux RND transporter periplasmic adaptor subunit [Pseudohoeflea sp. DP4N28-3]MBW3097076.1 efflux RND transporter periplasmic adaptor subunit [Pseudohoeflea sp. DP4N28-3]
MSLLKQLLASIAVLLVAVLGWIMLDPQAASLLGKAGVPVPAMLAAAPEASEGDARAGAGPGRRRGGGAALVVTAPVTEATINDRFSAIGTGAPARTVSVQPQVAGQIAAIEVSSGSRVAAGDVLVRLDSTEEEIARDQAQLALTTAEEKLERTENLLRQKTISSVEAGNARSEAQNARLVLRQAELDLARRTIHAPIDGTIGILNVSRGDFVTNQTVISTIDDRDRIIVDFYVPERLVASIAIGAPVEAQSIARPGEVFDGTVSALDNRLDEASRTLRVRAEIANDEDRLRAGMSFQVRMRFAGETYPAVDPLAIQWGADGAYVWRVKDGIAEKVAVSIIQRNAEAVLVEAALAPGEVVVTEGVQSVRANGPVRELSQDGAQVSPGAGQRQPSADGSADGRDGEQNGGRRRAG